MSTATVWNDCIGKLKFILPVTGSARGQSPAVVFLSIVNRGRAQAGCLGL